MKITEDEIEIISYDIVLQQLQKQENHLLIGNGFNYGLGISTGYKEIFEQMIAKKGSIYKEALNILIECNYDLELFIGRLEKNVNNDIFLKKYINNKIKLDFMQAAQKIVNIGIKNIYARKNEGVFVLLNNFTNYFSLNYDSCLYLLLLKYKPINNINKNTILFPSSIKFIEDDINDKQNNIYNEVKIARQNGKLNINFGNDFPLDKQLNKINKGLLVKTIKEYSKENKKGWKNTEIDYVVKTVLNEEKRQNLFINFDDGSYQTKLFNNSNDYVFDLESQTQNLFFIHGAFHIYKDNQLFKKITQKSDKALYERLEEIINNEEKEIICVFQNKNKADEIFENEYLKKCYDKLRQLSGNLVIIGSSLADNDNHIFKQINDSLIENIYISAFGDKENIYKIAKSKFPNKNIILFDAETISYELTLENKI